MTEPQPTWWGDARHDPIHLAAVKWSLRLRHPEVSEEETIAWQRWMLEDPRHVQAYVRVDEMSRLLSDVRPPVIAPLGEWRSRRPLRAWAIAASVLVAVTTAAVLWLGNSSETLRTVVAQTRTIQLADGSKVILGGHSEMDVRFGADRRSIALRKGEATFYVAKDAGRPFEVRAGDTTVIAVGTEFNVRRRVDRVDVAVIEGRVLVEPDKQLFKPQQPSMPLAAGQQTTADEGGIQPAVPLADPTTATAWQSGRLPFRLEPLRYVVEDVNRYLTKPIVVEDPALGALPFTGTVMSDNVKGWIDSLKTIFDVEAVEEAERTVIRRRRP